MNTRATISVLLLLVLLAVGGLYFWIQTRAPAKVPVATSDVTLNQDLYPLYSGVSWGAPAAESFLISTTTYTGVSIASVPVTNTMDPASIFTPFESYYDQKLKALGWSIANELAAGGHVGGQTGYRKEGQVVLTRFHIDYHNVPSNAPSECPCDVTLSLFSSKP